MFNFFFFKKKKADNRRKAVRKYTRNLVSVELPQRHVLNLVNISERGLQFSCPQRLKKDQTVSLTVNLAEAGAQIQVLGRVAWSKKFASAESKVYRIGVSFIELSQEAGQLIRHFVTPALKVA